VSPKLAVTSLRVKNFKAVHDTGVLKPEPLTVFIGDNGTGKSSVLEALRFARELALGTLDEALAPFGGYEHLRWKGGAQLGRVTPEAPLKEYHPVEITVRGHTGRVRVRATTRITGQNKNEVVFEHEELKVGAETSGRDPEEDRSWRAGRSIFSRTRWFDDWQFLDLVPGRMGQPVKRTQTGAAVRLLPDGSNLAEYILDLRSVPERGVDAFNGLIEALRVILPYARDIETVMREIFGREVALMLREGSFTVPGWMLSTGTLRLIALLALLRHPKPPSLLCIEEIENGLDPRTIHLVLDEILRATTKGRTQVMLTTHSPYFLDLVPLGSLVLVSREEGQPPRFTRPADSEAVQAWAKRFAPGQLYVTGTFHRGTGE
jgi:predicted ATPase